MTWTVLLTDAAVEDLERLDRSVVIRVVKKLKHLADAGPQAGKPLGARGGLNLVGLRKIVVGNRDWRIVFSSEDDRRITILVIGERSDDWCYEEAARRIKQLDNAHPAHRPLEQLLERMSDVRHAKAEVEKTRDGPRGRSKRRRDRLREATRRRKKGGPAEQT
ncbi:MAG: type II toxin-antitoxin system RelE/ParE family toxin [Acidimicrobiia bacterium]|nr:type II toxin-antitoxin system RelE/ParE family toxin [Acidimicrobiia bacterium]